MTLTDFLPARIAEDERHARDVVLNGYDRYESLNFRVLAECQAKRRIVTIAQDNPNDWGAEMAAYYLAQVYADHPDYREEWKP